MSPDPHIWVIETWPLGWQGNQERTDIQTHVQKSWDQVGHTVVTAASPAWRHSTFIYTSEWKRQVYLLHKVEWGGRFSHSWSWGLDGKHCEKRSCYRYLLHCQHSHPDQGPAKGFAIPTGCSWQWYTFTQDFTRSSHLMLIFISAKLMDEKTKV